MVRKREQQSSILTRAPATVRRGGEEMELGDYDPVMAQFISNMAE